MAADPEFPSLNPYASIATKISPYRVDPVNLREETEYILPFGTDGKRSGSERLMWATGSSYITGVLAGSSWGVIEGIRRSPGQSTKLRANSVLNSIGRRGPLVANNIAVIALMYRIIDMSVVKARSGTDDVYNQIGSGALTGMLFRCTAGPRAIAVAGTLGLVVAAGAIAANPILKL